MSQANKPGFGKGCFGSPTRKTRRNAKHRLMNMRQSAYRYARSYVKRRIKQSPIMAQSMKDERRRNAEIERVASRRIRVLRAKESGKRTSGAQKV